MTRLIMSARVVLVTLVLLVLSPPASRVTVNRTVGQMGIGHLQGAATQTPEPPHFPVGEYCEHADQSPRPKHACACKLWCESDPDTPTGHNDPRCGQYCHADSCACERNCQ